MKCVVVLDRYTIDVPLYVNVRWAKGIYWGKGKKESTERRRKDNVVVYGMQEFKVMKCTMSQGD